MDVIDEITETMNARILEYITLCIVEANAREIARVARELAEEMGITVEEAVGAMEHAIQGGTDTKSAIERLEEWLRENGEFLDRRTAWDWKEEREKRRAVERATAARFRQQKGRESAWSTKKRTGQRRREWRGPWREAKRTN